jgi:hypothetical protein
MNKEKFMQWLEGRYHDTVTDIKKTLIRAIIDEIQSGTFDDDSLQQEKFKPKMIQNNFEQTASEFE